MNLERNKLHGDILSLENELKHIRDRHEIDKRAIAMEKEEEVSSEKKRLEEEKELEMN